MTRRTAFTLVELMVVIAIGIVVLIAAYQAIHFMADAERTTDRASHRTITEARLSEALLRDLRSSFAVKRVSDAEYAIRRHVLTGAVMEERTVTWKLIAGTRVVREAAGEPVVEFDFNGLLDPGEPAFRLRLERVPDATFGSPDAVPSPSPSPSPAALEPPRAPEK